MQSVWATQLVSLSLSQAPTRMRSQFLLLPIACKHSHFQDFQDVDYAKPSRLLQVGQVKVCLQDMEAFSSLTTALYKVELGTSPFSASALTDSNTGVLLSLIDHNGDSLLHRFPSASPDHSSLHFQRGSLDEFFFEGDPLRTLKALWIGVDSGQWRLNKVSLTVIRVSRSTTEISEPQSKYVGVKYDFQVEDVQLGEGCKLSMLELRPCLATQLSGVDLSALLSPSFSDSTLLETKLILNKESMKEYRNLKLSLLLYDAVLVLLGTSAASFSFGDRDAVAFLVGGVSGFLYLLLLQRSVDGLPSPQNEGVSDEMFGGYKGPMISSIALAFGFGLFAFEYSSGEFRNMFTAKDVVLGMVGFLACKVSVVLAALKPLPKRLKD